MQPRPYQIEIEKQLEAGWAEASKQLVVSTMGSGKTLTFCWLSQRFNRAGKKVLILVDQNELASQAVKKLKATTGIDCHLEQGEYRASKDAPVVVASVQSLCRRLDKWPQDHFGLIIADEADKSLAATWRLCLNHFDGTAKVAGFTATPNRGDCRSLGEYYERIAFEAYFFDFIGNGKWAFEIVDGQRVQKNWVSPISVQMLPIKIDVTNFGAGKDFTKEEADEIISPHLLEIAKAIQHYASFRRTLLFLPLVKTCQRFVEVARDIGLSADSVSGVDDESGDKMNRFRNWEFDVLANSMLLTRGVDIPEIDAIMVARPTKSVSLYQQMVGRGTRICAGKENLLLLDPLYVADNRMICRPANLIAANPEEANEITDELGKAGFESDAEQCELDLMMTAASAREKALMRELEKNKEAKSKLFSLENLAVAFKNPELSHFEPITANESRPVSEKQLKWLQKIKVSSDGKFFIYGGAPQGSKPLDIGEIKNEGHASRVLEVAFNKQNQGIAKASYAQMKRMASMGYPGAWQATHGEAVKFFAGLNK